MMRFIQFNSLSYKCIASDKFMQMGMKVDAEKAMFRVARFLKNSGADIINLQECDSITTKHLFDFLGESHHIFFRGSLLQKNSKVKGYNVATLVRKTYGDVFSCDNLNLDGNRVASFIECADLNLVIVCTHLPVHGGLRRQKYFLAIFRKIFEEYKGKRILFSADTNLFKDDPHTETTLDVFKLLVLRGFDFLPRPKDNIITTFYGMPYDKYAGMGKSVLDYVIWSEMERVNFTLKFIDPIDGHDFPVSDHAALIIDFKLKSRG